MGPVVGSHETYLVEEDRLWGSGALVLLVLLLSKAANVFLQAVDGAPRNERLGSGALHNGLAQLHDGEVTAKDGEMKQSGHLKYFSHTRGDVFPPQRGGSSIIEMQVKVS